MSKDIANTVTIVSTPQARLNGFLFSKYNLLVTSYQGVDGFREVVVRAGGLPKQKAVIQGFDPVYNVAFYRLPFIVNHKFHADKFYLPNVGQHVRFLIRTVSAGVMSYNAVVMKFSERHNIPFFQLRSDFVSSIALGALVVDNDDLPLGIVVGSLYDRLEVLPMKSLIESILDITDYDAYAFRCPYCGEILTNETVSMGKCTYCGQLLPEHLYIEKEYVPGKFEVKIDQVISLLNYDPALARLDRNFWELEKSDVRVFINYDEEQNSMVAYTQLTELPDRLLLAKRQQVYDFLITQNNNMKYLSLSLDHNRVVLSTVYINLETLIPAQAIELIRSLFAEASEIKHRISNLTG